MAESQRNKILAELTKNTGKIVSWRFIKQTSNFIPAIARFHNLITGIFKPQWSEYALSIVIRLGSPYEHKDDIVFLNDGRWLMTYSPRIGGLSESDNRALVKCMDDQVPLGVFKQVTDKTNKKTGSTYQILGLGLITSFDAKNEVFIVENVTPSVLERVTLAIPDEAVRNEIYLYAQVMNEFKPFLKEERAIYTTSMPKRDLAFRDIVIREYDFTCAICEMKFQLGDLVEATAAHIIPKYQNGTDDPRNGLSLCRTHHWAFDNGIFAISEDYKVRLSQVIQSAETRNFALADMNQKPILLPRNEGLKPHPDALKWHQNYVWRG